jgi:hypothetical protein
MLAEIKNRCTFATLNDMNITANKAKRTFTICKNGSKYRTTRMSKQEFETCLYNSLSDWDNFLKSNQYYIVK